MLKVRKSYHFLRAYIFAFNNFNIKSVLDVFPATKFFFLLMDLGFFFFLVLLKLCIPSSLDETSVAPNEKVFSYFS